MRKIINGKRYDTETATQLGEWSNDLYGDFGYCYEALYQKRTGEYFLYGKGGPMSKYAESTGQNSWSGRGGIESLSEPEARVWAEEHLTADEYEAIFPVESEEPNETPSLLGRSVRNRRDFLGLSQADVAKKSGTSQQYIARVEAGEVDPQLTTLRRVAAALDMPLSELVASL